MRNWNANNLALYFLPAKMLKFWMRTRLYQLDSLAQDLGGISEAASLPNNDLEMCSVYETAL
jgi:hypothetical protein